MIKSYCKLNLSLKVLKKNFFKLHDIQTNTVLLKIHDEIEIKNINKKKDIIIFRGEFKKPIDVLKNTVLNTLEILRKENHISKDNCYKVMINKKIPIFSGLGGGTGNSAALIKYFIKKKINNKILNTFEKKIGSDLSLFFSNQSFQKNLRKIFEYKKKFTLYFILVYPNIKCSTKHIFANVKKFSQPSKKDFSRISSRIKFIDLIKQERNDLQKIAISKFSLIKKVLDFISIQKGCHFSRMTGSGSVCFGMFKSEKSAILGLKTIKKKFPRYWCVVTKTI